MMAGHIDRRQLSDLEKRQKAAHDAILTSMRRIDPDGNGEIRMALVVVLEAIAEYVESRRIPGRRGRVNRPGADPDELLTALGIEPGSKADKRLEAMRNDLLR